MRYGVPCQFITHSLSDLYIYLVSPKLNRDGRTLTFCLDVTSYLITPRGTCQELIHRFVLGMLDETSRSENALATIESQDFWLS